MDFVTLHQIDEAVSFLLQKTTYRPKIGLILGSGLNDLANAVEEAITIPFDEIPQWPVSTVQGHAGRLVLGKLEGKAVLVMQGRVHFYEGYSMSRVGFPMRVMSRLGVETLIVTNAAGGVNPDYQPGEVMLISDHLSLVTMAGHNPLSGPNLDEFGPRFPDMSQAYDVEYRRIVREIAKNKGLTLYEGVYAGLAGPSFETPADLRFLRMIGADAVGMSTVPEVILARHAGVRVLGFSGISNKANLDGSTLTTHEEVLEAGHKIVPKLTALITGFLIHI